MAKKIKDAFERFENFAKALIAVPHKELKKQVAKHKRHKKKKSAA